MSTSVAKPVSTVLIAADELLRPRGFFAMMLLAAAAGSVNLIGFLDSKRYVTHVTGVATRIGMDFGRWSLMFEYLLVLGAFVAGSMLSTLAVQLRVARGREPRPAHALLGTALVLLFVAVEGHEGLFGRMGDRAEQNVDFALMASLALAMGLLNATVASTTALAFRPTHVTGSATDFGVQLALALGGHGDERRRAAKLAALRGGSIGAFAAGAGAAVPLVKAVQHLALLAPMATILGVAAVCFRRPTEATART